MIMSVYIDSSYMTQLNNFDEESLVRGLVKRKKEAFNLFFEHYIKRLYNFVYQRLDCNMHDAEDVTQEISIKAINSINSFRGGSGLYTWLCAMAKNRIYDIRNAKGRIPKQINSDLIANTESFSNEELNDEEHDKKKEAVNLAMSSLSPHYQQILEAKYILKLSQKDIAQKLKISEKAVESLLTRSRDALRRALTGILKEQDL